MSFRMETQDKLFETESLAVLEDPLKPLLIEKQEELLPKNKKVGKGIFYFLFAVSGFSGLIYESIWTHYLKLFLGHAAYAQSLVLIIFMGGMALGAWGIGRYSLKIRNLLLVYALVEGIIGLLGILFHPMFVTATDLAYFSIIPQLNSGMAVNFFKWGLASLIILPQSILLGATFPLMSGGIIRRFPQTPGRSLAFLYFVNSLGAAIGILVSGFLLIEYFGLPGTIMIAGILNILLALVVGAICYRKTHHRSRDFVSEKFQPKRISSQRLSLIFLLVAGLTGTASFMYEIGWIRMLSLVLGSSTHAFELMLSSFILGLAIGGYLISRKIDKLSNPVYTLGLVQLVMGGFALLTLLSYGHTFDLMSYAIKTFPKTGQGYAYFNLFSHGLAIFIMLPATVCAGMTLPLLTHTLMSNGQGEGSIGKIYAANTVGAIAGVLIGVHLIMPVLGVKNLIVMGGGIDILLGLILLWYSKSQISRIKWSVVAAIFTGIVLLNAFWIELDSAKMASGVYRNGIAASESKILFHKDGKTASVDLVRNGSGKLSILTNGKPDAAISYSNIASPDEITMIMLAALPLAIHSNAKTVANIGFGSGLTSHLLLMDPDIDEVDIVEIEPAIVEAAKGFGERVANNYTDPRSHIYFEDAKTFFTNAGKQYDLIISEPSNPWVSGVAGLFSKEFYRLIRNYIKDDGLFVQWMHLYEIDTPLIASIIKALSENFVDYSIYFTGDQNIIILAGKQQINRQLSDRIFTIPGLKPELARVKIFGKQDLQLRKLGSKKTLDPLFNSYDIPANSDYFPILDIRAVKARYLKSDATELVRLRSAPMPLLETLANDTALQTSGFGSLPENSILSYRAHQGKAIFQYFRYLEDRNNTPTIPMDQKTTQIVRSFRLIREKCETKDIIENWFPSISYLLDLTLPYLSSQEMKMIWSDIESAPCFSNIPPEIMNLVNLYRSLGSRDFDQVLKISTQLLPPGAIKASRWNDYFLMAAMLANLALENKAAAVELWSRYENKENPIIELRLLSAVSKQ